MNFISVRFFGTVTRAAACTCYHLGKERKEEVRLVLTAQLIVIRLFSDIARDYCRTGVLWRVWLQQME